MNLSFTYPWVLLLLAVPVLLALWEVTRTGHRVALPLDHGRQRTGRWLNRVVVAANLLPAIVLAIAIVILAGPLKPGKPVSSRVLTNIEFCLDVSGSMEAKMGDGTRRRYDAAMEAINEFTQQRKGDAFGLTIFGNEVLRWVPLTKDLDVVRAATPFLDPEKLPYYFGGTEIGKGLRYCRDRLVEQEEGDRLIVLVSDGMSADLGGDIPHQLGSELAAQNITLYSIFIGDGQAPAQMYAVTQPTGGEVFAAGDPEGLRQVFAHIDRMQPVRMQPSAVQKVDNFRWFAVAGLAAAGLYQLALMGVRYTPW